MDHRIVPLFVALLAVPASAQVLAFPGAEGFGRHATGARTDLAAASVYHVRNLDDTGPGSFRDAVSQSNRFVVFDLSGVIRLKSPVTVSPNVTITGQTAPGGGITLYGAKVSFSSADNAIVRYLRFRKGTVSRRDDAVSLSAGRNLIFDHVSVTWGNDETFSMNPARGKSIDKVTVQDSIIGRGLDNENHSAGGLIQPDGAVSLIRNLFIDNETRNPKVKGTNQFVNNVVYNWTKGAYILGGNSSGKSLANIEGNLFITAAEGSARPFTGANANFHAYAKDNVYDANRDGRLDPSPIAPDAYGPVTWRETPAEAPPVSVLSPQALFESVVADVGPSLHRDEVDERMIEELKSLGKLAQIVVRETDLFPQYPATLPSPPKPADADDDAIPDEWESRHGLDPANASDWKNVGEGGYTRLEEYLNELARRRPGR